MKFATYTILMFLAFCHLAYGMEQQKHSDELKKHISLYNQDGNFNSLSEASLLSKVMACEGSNDARLLNNYIEAAFFLKYLSQHTLDDLYSICKVIPERNMESASTVFYVLNPRALDVLIRDISIPVLAAEEKKENPADFMFNYYSGLKNKISQNFIEKVGCPNFPSVSDINLALPKFF